MQLYAYLCSLTKIEYSRIINRRTIMATYILVFDPTGRHPETFDVPLDKKVYLVRAPQVSQGTATVQDLLTLENYVIPDGVTVYETDIEPGTRVSLAFMARTNNDIHSVNAEVISPR
jgi:hypothetical protein